MAAALIEEAESLQKVMDVFKWTLKKPLLELYFEIRNVGYRPQEGRVLVELAHGRDPESEYANMSDYWTHVCRILKSSLPPSKKVKTLFGFERTVAIYYKKNFTKEQDNIYRTVQGLLNKIIATNQPKSYMLTIPQDPSVYGKMPPRVREANIQTLENKLFLDPKEFNKLTAFTLTDKFGDGMPYTTEIRDIPFKIV